MLDSITDLNKMRRSFSTMVKVPATTASALYVPYAENRVALILLAHATASQRIGFRMDPTATEGIVIGASGQPILLSMSLHGDVVRGPFFALVSAGTAILSYVETLLDSP